MAILNKLLGSVIVSVSFLITQNTNCHASSPLSMEIKQVEIAKDVTDWGRRGGRVMGFVSETPRVRVLIELKNNGADTLLFYGNRSFDLFDVTYEYSNELYSQDMTIIICRDFGHDFFKIPPGETLPLSVIFDPEPIKDDDNPLNESGYAQMLWDMLPSLTITYTRENYGKEEVISASWGDHEDISIAKAQKEMK